MSPAVSADPAIDALGLSDADAAARLRRDGPNRVDRPGGRSLWRIALGIVKQPMSCCCWSPPRSTARTERVLASLKELSSPRARVVRSGRVLHVTSQELVMGDRLLIAEGDRLACDAVLREAHGLLVDESMLTGESAPVLKSAAGPTDAAPADQHRVHAGTLVVRPACCASTRPAR
jgi:P-type Ca2+ transporter type 2C